MAPWNHGTIGIIVVNVAKHGVENTKEEKMVKIGKVLHQPAVRTAQSAVLYKCTCPKFKTVPRSFEPGIFQLIVGRSSHSTTALHIRFCVLNTAVLNSSTNSFGISISDLLLGPFF